MQPKKVVNVKYYLKRHKKETKMRKRGIWAGFFGLMALAGLARLNAQSNLTLDDAIKQSATEIEGRLTQGIKIVVLNFNSPSERLSGYVIDELTGAIVNSGKITVVDRQNLALIQQEMNFQLSGEVSDESAQEIGRKLGAQSIISGSIEDLGQYYRLRFRVIEVVSAAIQLQPSKNVRKDSQVSALLGGATMSASTAQSAARAGSSTGYPQGLNYSTGHKVGAGFLNTFFWGTGSFTMGDWGGGLIIGGLQLTSQILYISGFVKILNATAEVYDSYGYDYKVDEDAITTGTVMIVASVGLALTQIIVGFVRPFAYDTSLARKNGTYTSLDTNPFEHINIVIVPDKKGPAAMNFTYSFSY
jgi:TolB-like protein